MTQYSDYDKITKGYYNFKARQRQTGCIVELNRIEFIEWWTNTGYIEERGSGSEEYCMSLIDVTKPYSTNNIVCIKNKDRELKNTIRNGKPVQTPYGLFPTMTSAIKGLLISRSKLHDKLKNDPTNYYRI